MKKITIDDDLYEKLVALKGKQSWSAYIIRMAKRRDEKQKASSERTQI